jgi:WD40 repeat protein
MTFPSIKRIFVPWISLPLAFLIAAACGTFEVIVEGTALPPGEVSASPTPAEAAPSSDPAAADVPALATPTATPDSVAAGVDPRLLGLIYRYSSSVNEVTEQFTMSQLYERAAVTPSPDGAYALYDGGNGIHLLTAATREDRLLVEADQDEVCCGVWWPARPDVVLYAILPSLDERGPGTLGQLAAVGIDGTDYGVLDAEHDPGPGPPAPAPDGERIAYGGGEVGYIKTWGGDVEVFDPRDYGLSTDTSLHIGSPAWSPDGDQLAWVIGNVPEPEQISTVVFDMAARTATIVHTHTVLGGRGGWFPAPVWSPDGEWLAVFTDDLPDRRYRTTVVRADGSEAHEIGAGSVVWHPSGEWLALNQLDAPDAEMVIHLVEVGVWEREPAGLIAGTEAIAWAAR